MDSIHSDRHKWISQDSHRYSSTKVKGSYYRKPSGSRPNRGEYRIQVLGLSTTTSWQDLKDWARQVGDSVVYGDVFIDRGRRVGIVEFEDKDDYLYALKELNGDKLHGKRLKVCKSDEIASVSDDDKSINSDDMDRGRDRDGKLNDIEYRHRQYLLRKSRGPKYSSRSSKYGYSGSSGYKSKRYTSPDNSYKYSSRRYRGRYNDYRSSRRHRSRHSRRSLSRSLSRSISGSDSMSNSRSRSRSRTRSRSIKKQSNRYRDEKKKRRRYTDDEDDDDNNMNDVDNENNENNNDDDKAVDTLLDKIEKDVKSSENNNNNENNVDYDDTKNEIQKNNDANINGN